MSTPVRDTRAMIAAMTPRLQDGAFAFTRWPEGTAWPEGTRASCVEAEGLSLIVPMENAPADAVAMRCITLEVHSSLEGVGLTAAVSTALADAGIPANMVAGYYHDHVYVPASLAQPALDVLTRLERDTAQ